MGEITDLIFTIFGKCGGVLNARGKRLCFIIWIICVCYWICRDYSNGLMVQTLGCFPTLAMHCYGYYNWKKKGIGS